MKRPFYKLAYRTVSWLSDRSGGWKLFVRWKVALATILIGISAASLTGCKSPEDEISTECYAPVVSCYDPVVEPEHDPNNHLNPNPENYEVISQTDTNK